MNQDQIDQIEYEISQAKPNFVYLNLDSSGFREEITKNKQLILAAVSRAGDCFSLASEDLRSDRDIVLAAVSSEDNAGACFHLIPEEFWEDEDIVTSAVASDGTAIEYAQVDNFFITKSALLTNPYTLRDSQFIMGEADEFELKALILMCVSLHGFGLQYFDELADDKDFVILIVTLSGNELEVVSDRLKDDIDVVNAAIKNHPLSIEFASERVKGIINIESPLIS